MTSMFEEPEYVEFRPGDRVYITNGTYEGREAVIHGFAEHQYHGTVVNVEVDNGAKVAILPDWMEKPEAKPVNILKQGMSSNDLAEAVHMVMHFCMDRINGPGNEQYAQGDSQKFEHMSMEELIENQIEEIADDINYAVMRFIRLRRIQAAMGNHL